MEQRTIGMPLSILVPGTGTHTGTGTISKEPLLRAFHMPPPSGGGQLIY